MKRQYYYTITFLLCLFLQSWSQSSNSIVEPKVKIDTTLTELLYVEASLINKSLTLQSVSYTIYFYQEELTTKTVSKKEDTGRIVLQPGEKPVIYRINIPKNTSDKITLVVLVYDDEDQLIGRFRQVVLNEELDAQAEKPQVTYNYEEEYTGLRGIVTEETKTKPGRDFFIEFSSSYRLKEINGPEIVKINERFSFGRSTIMEVVVGSAVVHRFFVQPTRDFIIQQTEIAIIKVSRYFIELEQNKQRLRQY